MKSMLSTDTVPAIEIIRKLKSKIDRQNFCRENSKFKLLICRLVYTNMGARIWYYFYFASYERRKEGKSLYNNT